MFAQGTDKAGLPVAIGEVLPTVLAGLGIVAPAGSEAAGVALGQCYGATTRPSRYAGPTKPVGPPWPSGRDPYDEGRRPRSPDRTGLQIADRCV